MATKKNVEVSSLTNDQVRDEAAKILAARQVQRERMKVRGKAKREYVKQLLAVAAQKNLLPKVTIGSPSQTKA